MTLDGVMALILRYFTEFVYDVVVKQLPRFQNLLLMVYDHINTICAIGFKRIRFAHFDRLCGPDISMSPLYAFVYVKITRTHQEMR